MTVVSSDSLRRTILVNTDESDVQCHFQHIKSISAVSLLRSRYVRRYVMKVFGVFVSVFVLHIQLYFN